MNKYLFLGLLLTSCASVEKSNELINLNTVTIPTEEQKLSLNPALAVAIESPQRTSDLLKNNTFIKGYNTSSCMTNMWNELKVPAHLSFLNCSCFEEVKELILKDKYIEESSKFRNAYVESMCFSMSVTFMNNPELIKNMLDSELSKFSDPMPLELLKDESQLLESKSEEENDEESTDEDLIENSPVNELE